MKYKYDAATIQKTLLDIEEDISLQREYEYISIVSGIPRDLLVDCIKFLLEQNEDLSLK